MNSTLALATGRSFTDGYRRLAALLRDLVAQQSVEAVLARLLATLRELIRCEDVVIWECVGDEMLRVVLVDGEDEEELRRLRIRLGEGLTGLAALEGRTVVSNDAHIDPRAGLVPGTEQTPEAVACVPLIARERRLGALTLYRRGSIRAFAVHEVALISDFAAIAALALDNARIHGELERLATTDDLTGLANRRRFRAELEREVATATRYGSPLSLLLLDLDNFKMINDTYGHIAGDEALVDVARAIAAELRAPDFAARLGGDEFAVLLPQTTAADASALARRLERAIARARTPQAMSVSIGMSTLGGGGSSLLDDADRFLYEAKRRHPSTDSLQFVAPATPTP